MITSIRFALTGFTLPGFALTLACVGLICLPAVAAEPEATAEKNDIPEGHSYHGDTFNEGPRQAAVLMEGMGNVVFPASTSNAQAQRFINQGVAQLHGFWYYEAERSFRQAATLDPDCAISYWGMALANVNNRKRAQGFIKQAVKRRDNASPREQMFIDAWSQALDRSGKTEVS